MSDLIREANGAWYAYALIAFIYTVVLVIAIFGFLSLRDFLHTRRETRRLDAIVKLELAKLNAKQVKRKSDSNGTSQSGKKAPGSRKKERG